MKISIFGLGYVGAVTAGCLTELGHSVIGADVLDKKVQAFNDGVSPIVEPGLDALLKQANKDGKLSGTTSPKEAVHASDVSIVCVGTPSQQNGRLDLSYVRTVTQQISEALEIKDGEHALIFRSTMLPGSTRDMVDGYLQQHIDSGKLTVFYAPEFLREGTAIDDFRKPSLVVIGTENGVITSREDIASLLGGSPQVLPWEGAELIKYSCNYFHAVKVAFANEIGRVGKNLGVDSRRIMEVLCEDTRLNISSYYMRPGNPFGGSCLPKDVSALASLARQEGISMPILDSVVPSNVSHLDALLNTIKHGGEKKVAILGLAFKQDTDDLRGSPMVNVAEYLLGHGYELKIYDQHLNLAELMGSNERVISRTMPHLSDLLCSSVEETLEGSELVIAAQKCISIEELKPLVNLNQRVIDVNGWKEIEALAWNYEGSCW